MKIKDVLDVLSKENPDALVILSRDGEGNSFSPLADWSRQGYSSSTPWSGVITGPEDESEGDEVECICLWPTS